MTDTAKHYFFDTYGCAKNQVDAEVIMTRMHSLGWTAVDDAKDASLIIVNTCGFIESAKKQSLDAVLSARKNYPDAKILVAGCLAQRYADVFTDELHEADGVFGNGDILKIDEVLHTLEKSQRPVVVPPQHNIVEADRTVFLGFPSSTYIKITEGCDNHCSFCAIPLIRGKLRSRSIDSVVNEIKSLLQKNIFEFNLIGQDVAAFGSDFFPEIKNGKFTWNDYEQSPLSQLLSKISEIEGNFWIRLLYIHPDHFPTDILPIMQKDKRFLPYFDIPFQSGDDDVIHAMNRTGTRQTYENLICRIKEFLPTAALRTTLLCGFPGETNEAFENSADFLQTIRPLWSGSFTYSREENTPASVFKKHVSDKTAKARSEHLQNIQSTVTEEELHKHVGKTYDVLIEEMIEGENFAIGRTWFQAPEVDGSCVVCFDDEEDRNHIKPGAVVKVCITGVRSVDVVGNYERR
ncbi:MAG: 30S ribosomal protein S12 methylthiotransferase RimO [Spirochaetales bacterium]